MAPFCWGQRYQTLGKTSTLNDGYCFYRMGLRPSDRKIFAIENLWPSTLLKFTAARLSLKKDSLKSQKDWVFLKNMCGSRMMLLKAELKNVCCYLCNIYRLFMYFSCAAISVVIHRRGKITIFCQMAILLVFVTLPVRSLWSMASAAVQND